MYYSEGDFDIAERVEWVAGRRNALPIQVALAWLLKQPGITSPIIGVVSPQQLDELIPALDLDLSAEELEHLEENYQPKPIFGHE
jgi:aryl-alcohol dehydrogenase (NADP+)